MTIWKPHIDTIANKVTKFSGVLNRLKRYLPGYILRTLYCSMVQSRLTYCILACGFNYQRLIKIQKRFMRIITLSKYNAHTGPIFKSLDLLNMKGLFDLSCLKFVYKIKKLSLPNYFRTFKCIPRSSIYDHDTRYSSLNDAKGTRTVMAGNCIRHHLVTVLNDTPQCIIDKISTHSLLGFSLCIKRYYLNQLNYECDIRDIYVCRYTHLITLWSDDVIRRQRTEPSLVHVMACRLFGARLLHAPVLTYWQLWPSGIGVIDT